MFQESKEELARRLARREAAYDAVAAASRDYFLLGLGGRRKLIWRGGALLDAHSGDVVREFDASHVWVKPDRFEVWFQAPDGIGMKVEDNEEGTWLGNRGTQWGEHSVSVVQRRGTYLSEDPVSFAFDVQGVAPEKWFPDLPYYPVLRALWQEIAFNVEGGVPLPNLFVYRRPSYRVAALVCMVLEQTGNLDLVGDWIHSLRDPFDRLGGREEPDNLGQALYLVSLVSDASHPLVKEVLQQVPRFRRGDYIAGATDGAEHPVYQTQWLKFGLRCLGLDDPFTVPHVHDSYSPLCWWGDRTRNVYNPRSDRETLERWRWVAWAEAHFYGDPPPLPEGTLVEYDDVMGRPFRLFAGPYPFSRDECPRDVDCSGMAVLSPEDARNHVCRPHAGHAAEMFLYLYEQGVKTLHR